MTQDLQDGPDGYIATDGRYIETPSMSELPDWDVDLETFRAPAQRSSVDAASRSYSRPFHYLNEALDHEANPLKKMVEGLMPADPKDFRRTEDILMAARSRKENRAEAAADALIDALATPDGAGQFRALLADVIGFGPVNYANGYSSFMERENPWVMPLLEALPPARLVPALASLTPSYIFDRYRTWFHEPAFEAFLTGPHGDLRHFEGAERVRDPVKSEPLIDVKRFMSGEMSTREVFEKTVELRQLTKGMHKASAETDAKDMSDMLGVAVSASDIKDMGVVGDELRSKLNERRAARRRLPSGAFAVEALRGGLTPRAAALPTRLWANYLPEHLDRIDRALGLERGPGKGFAYEVKIATALLRHLPATPARYKDALFRVASGKKRSGRADAQRLLRGTPGLIGRLAKEGRKKALDTRLQAAACLGATGDKAAIPALEDMLAAETKRTGENAILAALQTLGADVAAHAPDRGALIAEAEAVFDAPYPKDQRWLADLDLPALTFNDGTPAPITLAPWLVRLAAELGLPDGGPILDLRLAHLTKDSRHAFAKAALYAFEAHDTLRWEDMTTPDYRPRLLEQMYCDYAELFDWETGYLKDTYPDQYARRRDKLDWPTFRDQITEARIAKFLKDTRNWEPYVQSANDAKGILGLGRRLAPKDIRPTLQSYLQDHARRSAQTKAVMTLYASFGGKRVTTDLTNVAKTQKQKGLRAHAIDLLEDLGITYRAPPEPDEGTALNT